MAKVKSIFSDEYINRRYYELKALMSDLDEKLIAVQLKTSVATLYRIRKKFKKRTEVSNVK